MTTDFGLIRSFTGQFLVVFFSDYPADTVFSSLQAYRRPAHKELSLGLGEWLCLHVINPDASDF
ncbi:hypothetical protein [Marinobacter sp.]|uniref:hypothetical protein n=1 Tax=Marinobacter sp. TaxID=50741 RepID=UPI003A939319